jgi:hypothetical protein
MEEPSEWPSRDDADHRENGSGPEVQRKGGAQMAGLELGPLHQRSPEAQLSEHAQEGNPGRSQADDAEVPWSEQKCKQQEDYVVR